MAGCNVTLPPAPPCDFAYGLKVVGDHLKAVTAANASNR